MRNGNINILAVDDEKIMRRAVSAMAKAIGANAVFEASDGKSALKILLTSPIDFIVSDRNLPEMDGLDLLRSVRAKNVFCIVPFLMVSNDPNEAAVAEANEYGADGYLTKPFTYELIEERFKHIRQFRGAQLDAEILLARAGAFVDIGAFDDAAGELSSLRNLRPENPRLWIGAGDIYQEMDDHESAKSCYSTAIDLSAKSALAHDRLGLALMKEGRTEEAIESIRIATEISPRNSDRLQFLGKTLLAWGDTEGARRAFYNAVSTNADEAARNAAVAELFLISGRADLAEEEYAFALEADPGNSHFYNRNGIALRRQGKSAEAVENYRKVLKITPEDPIIYYNLAVALIDLKDHGQAVVALRKALTLDPHFQEAETVLRRLTEKDSPERKSGAPGAGAAVKSRSPRFRVPVVVLAPSLANSPLLLEDVSASGFRVVVSREPDPAIVHDLSLQVAGEAIGRCKGKVAWVRTNDTEPVTWSIGLVLQIPPGGKDRFAGALRKALGRRKNGAGNGA
ncbi:MAG: tetratricopeptide repeat protein [bacterium]